MIFKEINFDMKTSFKNIFLNISYAGSLGFRKIKKKYISEKVKKKEKRIIC